MGKFRANLTQVSEFRIIELLEPDPNPGWTRQWRRIRTGKCAGSLSRDPDSHYFEAFSKYKYWSNYPPCLGSSSKYDSLDSRHPVIPPFRRYFGAINHTQKHRTSGNICMPRVKGVGFTAFYISTRLGQSFLSSTHRIHVWYIHLHWVDFYGKCR